MYNKRKAFFCWFKFLIIVILIISILSVAVYFRIRPILYLLAQSRAETIMLNAASQAMLEVIAEENITYNSVARISKAETGEILGIEIDINEINIIKNRISFKVSEIIDENEFYYVSVPCGTLMGVEALSGVGPRLRFPMQLTSTVIVNYRTNFQSEGINQTLHQILITMEMNCNIVMLGFTDGFSVKTTQIAAQTVIVGETPDSFTNVIETPANDIADEIFNFADVN